MLFAVVDDATGVAGWALVIVSLGTALIAIFKTDREAKNRRADKELDAAISERERADKISMDSRIMTNEADIKKCKEQHAESDRKHAEALKHAQECEKLRLEEAQKAAEREKIHMRMAHDRAVAVAQLQELAGVEVTTVIPPKPPSSGSFRATDVVRGIVDDEDNHGGAE